VPVGHDVGTDIPSEGQYVPSSQGIGTMLLVLGQYEPIGHIFLLLSVQKYPVGQFSQIKLLKAYLLVLEL